MQSFIVQVKSIEKATHDVLRIVTEKPQNYSFKPGQANEISINKNGWKDKKNPFTFTCLPDEDYLEFTIKTYPSHKSVTNEMLNLKINDELILREAFGAIDYKGEGVFIAGGAGVTPFISIFRYLDSRNEIGNNMLIFANKTKKDIILENEFSKLLGPGFINILSEEKVPGYYSGQITEAFLKKQIVDFDKFFYLCGPPPMIDSIEKQLEKLEVDKRLIIKESF